MLRISVGEGCVTKIVDVLSTQSMRAPEVVKGIKESIKNNCVCVVVYELQGTEGYRISLNFLDVVRPGGNLLK